MSDGRIIIDTEIDTTGAEKDMDKAHKSAKSRAASLAAEYKKQGMSSSEAFKRAWADIERDSTTSLKRISKKIADAGEEGFEAFSKSVLVASTAMAALGGVVVGVGMEFESKMSRVKAISGATTEEFKLLNEQAKQLGADTSYSASQAAQGMENLASAGFSVNEIMQAMPGMLDLAASSGEDLSVASDIAATTLRGFGLEASKAGHVADVLAANAAKTNSNVYQTGEAMKYISAAASTAGLSLEEVTAAIGIMSNAGVQGSQAGTTLRGALTRLASPSKEASKAMETIGFNAYDSAGKMKPLAIQIEELRKGLEGLTDEQKQNIISNIYGQEAMSGMLSLINSAPGELAKLTAEYQKSDGAAKEMAATMKDNLKGAIDGLTGSAETLAINLYENVDNPLKNVVQSATEMVNGLNTAFTTGGFDALVSEIGNVISNIIAGIAQQAPAFINMGVIIIQNLVTGIQNNIQLIGTSAIDIITSLVNGFIAILPQMLEIGLQLLISLGEGILNAIPELVPTIIDLIIKICDLIIENLPLIIEIGIDIILALVDGLIQALPLLIQEIPRIINEFSSALFGQIPALIGAGFQIIWMLIQGLISSIPALVASIPDIIMAIVNVISLFSWASVGKTLVTKIGEGILNMKTNLATNAKTLAESGAKGIQDIFNSAFSWGQKLIVNIGEGIVSMPGYLWGKATQLADDAMAALKTMIDDAPQVGKDLITGLWNGITDMKKWILDKIGGFAGSIIGGIKGFFEVDSPSRIMRDLIGVNLVKGIGVGIELETPNLQKDIDTNMTNLVARMQGAVSFETARTTAGVVAQNNIYSNIPQTINQNSPGDNKAIIEIPVIIDGKEVARATAPYQDVIDGYNKGRAI